MKATEFIAELQKLIEEHGDLEVDTFDTSFGRRPCRVPRVRNRLILKGRQRTPALWNELASEDCKGEAVFVI
jgi:hypothetical protein